MKVKHTDEKGKGVFAKKYYAKGKLIMRHEILVIPPNQASKIGKTFLNNYMFFMSKVYFIALGLGSLLNHSAHPNLDYIFQKRTRQIEFYTLCKVKKGEELTIDYEWESYPWERILL